MTDAEYGDWVESQRAIREWYRDALGLPRDVERTWVHCDDLVLHSPASDCEFCALYGADLQQMRIAANMNFTGEYDLNKWPDPATMSRPEEIINRWYGNVPKRLDFYA